MYTASSEPVGYKLRQFEQRLAELELDGDAPGERAAFLSKFGDSPTHQFYLDRFKKLLQVDTRSFVDAAANLADGDRAAAHSYLTHGLHPYKGKYFPQVVRSLLNYAGVEKGQRVMDPFVGSGTTSLESSVMSIKATGIDRNPLAVLLADVKCDAVRLGVGVATDGIEQILHAPPDKCFSLPNRRYLERWFPVDNLECIEVILGQVQSVPADSVIKGLASITLSSLLRDWSFQRPGQLRIYRRPNAPGAEALVSKFRESLRRNAQIVEASVKLLDELGIRPESAHNVLGDAKHAGPWGSEEYDALITSPPYATALPYIDTDRLSIFALGLDEVDVRAELEWEMIGTREIGVGVRRHWENALGKNSSNLPHSVVDGIELIQRRNEAVDVGFRRRNMPALLYKYFSDMQSVFKQASHSLRSGSLAAVVIGDSWTRAGDTPTRIRTGSNLADIGSEVGFVCEERIPMDGQTAYMAHQRNGIRSEEILILRKA